MPGCDSLGEDGKALVPRPMMRAAFYLLRPPHIRDEDLYNNWRAKRRGGRFLTGMRCASVKSSVDAADDTATRWRSSFDIPGISWPRQHYYPGPGSSFFSLCYICVTHSLIYAWSRQGVPVPRHARNIRRARQTDSSVPFDVPSSYMVLSTVSSSAFKVLHLPRG